MRNRAEVRHEAVAALRADLVVSQTQHRHVGAEIGNVKERSQRHRALIADGVSREVESGASLDVSLSTNLHQRLDSAAADAVAGETDALQIGTGAHDQSVADTAPVLLRHARALVFLHRLDGEALQTGEARGAETVEERLVGLRANDAVWVGRIRDAYCR